MPLRQCDTKTVRRGPQVLSKRRLPNTIDRRRESLPPPGRVVGPNRSRAGQRGRRPLRERLASTTTALRDSNRWRGVSSRALRCAAATRARGCAFCYRRVDRTRLVRSAARRRQQKVDAALKRRSAFMTCVSGTLGQSTSHGDGRDDAPICKNVSAKFLGGRTLTPPPPPPNNPATCA